MIHVKPWEGMRRERDGRWPLRPCPADFGEVFVRIGRLACEQHFATRRKTVTRWLNEQGKDHLIAERARFVRERVASLRKAMPRILARAFPADGHRAAEDAIASEAAQFLRSIRNGGWIISPTPEGDWWVGLNRRSAAELVELAKAKGFDADLHGTGQSRVSSGR